MLLAMKLFMPSYLTMGLKIGTIEYMQGNESFEVNEIEVISRLYHEEEGGYKEPNDTIETLKFKVKTEHGTITGEATARRSGFDTHYEYEDNIELKIDSDDKTIEILTPTCIVEIDEEDN